jgi:phospholipid/cholesterol/gamma-HCH transport system substrate-binding protein
MTQTTLPAANAAIQDLRRTSESLRVLTEKLESQGAGSLIGGGKLPDYQP